MIRKNWYKFFIGFLFTLCLLTLLSVWGSSVGCPGMPDLSFFSVEACATQSLVITLLLFIPGLDFFPTVHFLTTMPGIMLLYLIDMVMFFFVYGITTFFVFVFIDIFNRIFPKYPPEK
jgi:hypothetical protein